MADRPTADDVVPLHQRIRRQSDRLALARRAMTAALPILELHAARTGKWVDALDLVREWLGVGDG